MSLGRNQWSRAVGVGLVGIFWGALAHAEHTRVTNPNALNVEILGRGLTYSITYDRVVSDELAAGFGIGSVGTRLSNGNDANQTATLIPVYANYYFVREAGSLFATAGADLVTNSGDVKNFKSASADVDFPSSTVMPTFGLGYENRGDFGFLFRGAVYGIVGDTVKPWFGFTFGYAF